MMNSSQWSAPIQYGRWIINTIFHQGLAVIMMYAIWIPIEHYSNPFSWHVILCTIGLIPLMAEALILFSGGNVWSQDVERKTKYIIHGVLMGLSSVLIIAGVAIEVGRTKTTGHFESSHAITGLVSLIFLVLSIVLGFLASFSKHLSGYVKPVITKFCHNLGGQIAYIIGVVSFCLGFYTEWFKFYTSESSRTTASVATGIFCTWSLIYPVISAVKQIRNIINVTGKRVIPVESMGVNRPKSFILLSQDPRDDRENL